MVVGRQDAPDFELESDAGERVRLSSLRGSPVVLYFYPKDDDARGCNCSSLCRSLTLRLVTYAA